MKNDKCNPNSRGIFKFQLHLSFFIFHFIFICLFIFCTIDPPLSVPPENPPDASEAAILSVKKALRGLEYFEAYHHLKYPFHYDVIDTLSFALSRMTLSFTQSSLLDPFQPSAPRLYAKAFRSAACARLFSVPLSASLALGDSLSSVTIDSFTVVIRRLSAARTAAPVDSGIDSLFYCQNNLHHIHSKLFFNSGKTVEEREDDADGDGYVGTTADTVRLSLIRRSFVSADTCYFSAASMKHSLQGSDTSWIRYQEGILKAADTLMLHTMTRTDQMPITLSAGERLTDTLRYFGSARTENVVTRLLASSGSIANFAMDRYTFFEERRATADDSSYAVWTDADSNGVLWDPLASDTAEIIIHSVRRFRSGAVLCRAESTFVLLLQNGTSPSERILWQSAVDTLRDNTGIKARRFAQTSTAKAAWNSDTIFIVEEANYRASSTLADPFGRIAGSYLEYKLICDESGKRQLCNYLRLRHALDASNDAQYVLHELTLPAPVSLDSLKFKTGRYAKTIAFRSASLAPLDRIAEDFAFDFSDSSAPDSVWCNWRRAILSKANDSVVQEVHVNALGNGSLTETRTDSLAETMTFSRSDGSFFDTLWQVLPYRSPTELATNAGNIHKNANTGDWSLQTADRHVRLEHKAGQLTVSGQDSLINDSLFMSASGDSLVWNFSAAAYQCRAAYYRFPDGRISLSLTGKSSADGLLRLQSRDLYTYSNGIGSGIVREANPSSSTGLTGDTSDYIDYELYIHLHKHNRFSGYNF